MKKHKDIKPLPSGETPTIVASTNHPVDAINAHFAAHGIPVEHNDIHPIKSHDVPTSGSLTDMSYCLDCGAERGSSSNCVPDGHRDRRIQDSIDRKKRHTVRLQWFDGREWVTVGNEWVTEKNAWDSLGLDCYGYRTIDHNDVVLTDKQHFPNED